MRKKPQIKSRKQQRKNERLAKKARRHDFFSKKKKGQQQGDKSDENQQKIAPKINKKKTNGNKKGNLSLQDEKLSEVQQLKNQTKILQNEMKKKRVKMLKEDAAADDLEIQKLEKQLGLKKKNDKSKMNFFSSDGLDYLLDFCDGKKLKDAVEAERRFQESDDDFGDDLAKVQGKTVKKRSKKMKTEPAAKKKKMSPEDDDSGSEPDELLSTKVGSKLQAKKTREKNEDADNDLSDEDDSYIGDDNDSDENFDDSEENNDLEEESFEEPKKGLSTKIIKSKTKTAAKTPVFETKKNSKNDKSAKPKSGGDNHSEDEDEEEDIFEDSNGDDSSLADSEDENLGGEDSKKKDDGTWEDIYGRTRDREGNVVTKYQPPQMRKLNEEGGPKSEKLLRLKKQMKGLLNRLAENNMVNIASQIEALYGTHSRNEMNETLWSLYRESLLGETMTPDRLMVEHAMLLAVLAANVGGEVSAHCLQKCVMDWQHHWSSGTPVEDKKTNNILLLLSYMCHFKLFHGTLLYDILEQLLNKLQEKEVELILLVLRTVGFSLRKEDPVRLKDFVLKAQALANNTASASDGSRVKFLLDVILAIKNNNMTKIPNYNPEYAEKLKKSLKVCVRAGNYTAELKISLEDLLKAEERGRWWVVGSAWTGELPGEKPSEGPAKLLKKKDEGFSNKLLELAKKQRMNTDTRRTVFCVIMSSEDYLDAFEKLLKLGLKGPSEREIMNVLLHCLLQEKNFNPYYEHLARRFCVSERKFQVMLQFAIWDRIQELKSLSSTQVTNLAMFLGHLIIEKNLAISVLKVVEFGELDKASVRFIRQVILAILLTNSEESILAVFARIAGSKPLKLFREGLRLFLHHFVLRNSKEMVNADMDLLTKRVKLADSALSASDRNFSL